jgi:hypothetical protein
MVGAIAKVVTDSSCDQGQCGWQMAWSPCPYRQQQLHRLLNPLQQRRRSEVTRLLFEIFVELLL